MSKILLLVMAAFVVIPSNSNAMAIAYKDSVGIMAVNQSFHNELFTNYTLTPTVGLGHRYIRYLTTDGQKQFFIPEADFLIHRWNEAESQANIYFSAGYGAQSFMNTTTGVGMVNIDADWESRKYYLSGGFQSLVGSDSRYYNSGRLRAGLAPYLADFNELNAWFIVQFETMPFVANSPFLTPMIRLFYKNVLVELGADFQGNWLFNYMIHI